MTAIGGLRYRLTLEQAVTAEDGAGGATLTWSPAAELWGRIEEPSGREGTEAEAVAAERRVRIAIRHRAGLGPAMRFRLGARVFDIESVRDADGRRRWLACDCVERRLM